MAGVITPGTLPLDEQATASAAPDKSAMTPLPKAEKPVRWWQIKDEAQRKNAAKYVAMACSLIRSFGAGLLFYYTVITHFSYLEGVIALGLAACAGKAYMSYFQYNDTLEKKLFKFFSPKNESENEKGFLREVFGIFYTPELAEHSATFSTKPFKEWQINPKRWGWKAWVFFALAGETVAVFTSAQKVFGNWIKEFNGWLDSMHQNGVPVELAWGIAAFLGVFTIIVGMGLTKDSIEKKERLQDPLQVAGDQLVENIQQRQKLLNELAEAFSEKWDKTSSKKALLKLNEDVKKLQDELDGKKGIANWYNAQKLKNATAKRDALDATINQGLKESSLEWQEGSEIVTLDSKIRDYKIEIDALDKELNKARAEQLNKALIDRGLSTSIKKLQTQLAVAGHALGPLIQKRNALKMDMQILEREQLRVQVESLKLLRIRCLLKEYTPDTAAEQAELDERVKRKEAALAEYKNEVAKVQAADRAERARWLSAAVVVDEVDSEKTHTVMAVNDGVSAEKEFLFQESIENSDEYKKRHHFADVFSKIFGYFCSGLRTLGIIAITAGTITALFNGLGLVAIALGAGSAFILGAGRGKASYRLYTPELTEFFYWVGLGIYDLPDKISRYVSDYFKKASESEPVSTDVKKVDESEPASADVKKVDESEPASADVKKVNEPEPASTDVKKVAKLVPILHQQRPVPVSIAKLGILYRMKKNIINKGLVGGIMAMWGAVSEGMSMGISVVGLPLKILSILYALEVLHPDDDLSNAWTIPVKIVAGLVGLVSAACVGFGLPRNKLLQVLGVSQDTVDQKSEQLELLGKQNWSVLNTIEKEVKAHAAELNSDDLVSAPEKKSTDELKHIGKDQKGFTIIQKPTANKIKRADANQLFLSLNHQANQQTFAFQSEMAKSHHDRIKQAGFSSDSGERKLSLRKRSPAAPGA